jgi:hypothetical protein
MMSKSNCREFGRSAYIKARLVTYGDLHKLTTGSGAGSTDGTQGLQTGGGDGLGSLQQFYEDNTNFQRRGQSGDSGGRGGRQ